MISRVVVEACANDATENGTFRHQSKVFHQLLSFISEQIVRMLASEVKVLRKRSIRQSKEWLNHSYEVQNDLLTSLSHWGPGTSVRSRSGCALSLLPVLPTTLEVVHVSSVVRPDCCDSATNRPCR